MTGKNERYDFGAAEDVLGGDGSEREAESDTTTETETTTMSQSTRTSRDEVPHRVRYDSPKQERDQKMFYLEDDDLDRLSELERLAESTFEDTVHAIDVRLAAFRSDLTDESFLNEMRAIGYGYFE